MSDSTILTVTVPASELGAVRHKVELMAKRCWRWGMPVPALNEVGRRFVPDYASAPAGTPTAQLPKIELVDLALTTPSRIEIGGWSLLGRVDALPDGGPLLARVPGADMVPAPILASPYTCDHCQKTRTRSATFLVYNAGGEVRQVGRNCLRDFLGHDPSALLWLHQALSNLTTLAGSFAGRGERLWDTAVVLHTAARAAAHGGFLGRTKAAHMNDETQTQGLLRPMVEPTVTGVAWRLDPPRAGTAREKIDLAYNLAQWDRNHPDDDASAKLLAATTQALATLSPTSEWEANVIAVAGQPHLRSRHFGIAVSAVVLGLKAIEREDGITRRAARPSAHIGAIGERLDMPAQIAFIREFAGDWGTRTLIKFEAEGGSLAWWASGETPDRTDTTPWSVGDELTLRGTVKAHETDRYDGRAVTLLSRCVLRPRVLASALA